MHGPRGPTLASASDDQTVVLKIARATSKFPAMLSLSAFGIQSPKALEEGKANDVKKQGEGFAYPKNSENPVGTGPYTFDSYDEANKTVTLKRNDDYWGEKAKNAQITFKIIPDESTRRQELEANSIDGYDLPNPVDWKGLKDDGNNVEIRDPFNILYLGINQKAGPLADLRDDLLAQQHGDRLVDEAARLRIAHHRVAGVDRGRVDRLDRGDGVEDRRADALTTLVAREDRIDLGEGLALADARDDVGDVGRVHERAAPRAVAGVVGEVDRVHRPHLHTEALHGEDGRGVADVSVGDVGLDGQDRGHLSIIALPARTLCA